MSPKDGYLDPVPDDAAAQAEAQAPAAELQSDAPSEAPPAAEAVKPTKAKPPDGYVPVAALQQARFEQDQLRQQYQRTEANLQKFLDRFHAENEPKQPEAAEPPDWMADPIGRMQHEAGRIAELENRLTQSQQALQQEAAARSILQHSDMDIYQYVQQAPEAAQALTYLQQIGAQHLMQQGMTDPAQIKAAMDRWQVQLAVQARSTGVRPARLLHLMAIERGWQPQAPQQPAANGAEKPESDQARDQPRDPTTGQFVAADAEKNARIAKAQDLNMSLSSAPGAPVQKLDAKEFAKLTEKEQWQYLARHKGNKDFDRALNFRS